MLLKEEQEVAVISTEGRCMVFHTATITPKAARTYPGVVAMKLKEKYKVARVLPLSETSIVDVSRYRGKSLPLAGALLKDTDRGEVQMSLL